MFSLTRVRGMVTTHRQRSDRARFPIKTFLAVLISGERRMVARTRRLPRLPTVITSEMLCVECIPVWLNVKYSHIMSEE